MTSCSLTCIEGFSGFEWQAKDTRHSTGLLRFPPASPCSRLATGYGVRRYAWADGTRLRLGGALGDYPDAPHADPHADVERCDLLPGGPHHDLYSYRCPVHASRGLGPH